VRELTLTFFVKAGEMIKEGQAKRFSDDSSLDTKANAIDVSLSPLSE
jgi:fructose-1,6-bisphosphatase/inositol monophosphatase family enzyme